jgi:hypothetical protein
VGEELGLSNLEASKDDRKMRQKPRNIRTDVQGLPEAGAHTPNVVVREEPSSVFVLSLGKKKFKIFIFIFFVGLCRMMDAGLYF